MSIEFNLNCEINNKFHCFFTMDNCVSNKNFFYSAKQAQTKKSAFLFIFYLSV